MISSLGVVCYVIVAFSVFFISSVQRFILDAVALAPEITIAMVILYYIPLLIFSVHVFLKKRELSYKKQLSTQTVLCSSVSVSLGLVGTFLGLTEMVSAIAKSMSADGDATEKMSGMIASVSDALSAMSYAFLTSVVGVSISVLLLISLNFWSFFYKEKEEAGKKEHDSSLQPIILERLARIDEINTSLAGKLVSIPHHQDDENRCVNALETLVSLKKEQIDIMSANSCELQEAMSFIQDKLRSIERLNYEIQPLHKMIDEKIDRLTLLETQASNEQRAFRKKIINFFCGLKYD